MGTAVNVVLIVALVLAGVSALAVLVGRAIKRAAAADAEFRGALPDPNRDNHRDDLGDPR